MCKGTLGHPQRCTKCSIRHVLDASGPAPRYKSRVRFNISDNQEQCLARVRYQGCMFEVVHTTTDE